MELTQLNTEIVLPHALYLFNIRDRNIAMQIGDIDITDEIWYEVDTKLISSDDGYAPFFKTEKQLTRVRIENLLKARSGALWMIREQNSQEL